MYKEIPYNDEIKFVLFENINFWDSIYSKTLLNSPWIDIVTYNLNFSHRNQSSIYEKLRNAAEKKGIDIRIIFNKNTANSDKQPVFDKSFQNFIACFHSPNNHAKIFLSRDLAFIGSANYSIGSNKNIECGVIITNKNVIKNIRSEFITSIAYKSKLINTPNIFNELYFIDMIIDASELIKKSIKTNQLLNDKLTIDLIAEFRFISDVNDFVETMDLEPFHIEYDWGEFMFKSHQGVVTKNDTYIFLNYIIDLEYYMNKLKLTLINKYENEGGRSSVLGVNEEE